MRKQAFDAAAGFFASRGTACAGGFSVGHERQVLETCSMIDQLNKNSPMKNN
jgi:hypothetical protein